MLKKKKNTAAEDFTTLTALKWLFSSEVVGVHRAGAAANSSAMPAVHTGTFSSVIIMQNTAGAAAFCSPTHYTPNAVTCCKTGLNL